MIRVTYYDNSIEEYDLSLKEVLNITKYSKIEKQVKDLTVEELTKLNAMLVKSKTSSVAFDETKVAGQGLLSGRNGRTKTTYFVDYDDKFYELDEYVDITSIIKEE